MQITYMSVKSESNQILTFKRNAKMLRLKKRYITYDNKEYKQKIIITRNQNHHFLEWLIDVF